MRNVKVSIITATYNSARYISDTYESIVNQTHDNWEWIITDDCSDDDTYNKIVHLSSLDNRIKIFRNDINKGCLLYTSPSPRDGLLSRMPSSA